MDFIGTSGRDNYVGTSLADEFDMSQGGRDTVSGLEGDDVFLFGTELNDNEDVDGGDGHDTVVLDGNYLGGLILLATTLVNVEEIVVEAGFNYSLTLDDATATAAVFFVDAGGLGAGDALVLDGSAETAAALDVTGGAGDDLITGGAGADVFDLDLGGADTVSGGDGDDAFAFMGALDLADEIDGGAGFDTLTLDGNYFAGFTFGPTTMLNVEELRLESQGFDYTLVLDEATADPANGGFTIDANLMPASHGVTIDFSAETDARYDVHGGRGDDVITAGFYFADFWLSQGGEDTVFGSSRSDTFWMYEELSAENSLDGSFGTDTLWLAGDYAGLVITGAMVSDFEETQISPQYDVDLTYTDDVMAAGRTHRVYVPSFGAVAGHQISVDASAETDAFWTFDAAISDDTFIGGALADEFDFQSTSGGGQGGIDVADGNGGDDLILFDGAFTRDDEVDGGAGVDELELEGDLSAGINFRAATMKDVEQLTLVAGYSYGFTVGDNNVDSDGLAVTADTLLTGETLAYDGSAESSANVTVLAGAGDDTILTGAGDDTLHGGDGHDVLAGGAGDDTINAARGRDTITGGAGTDKMRGGLAANTFVFDGVAESTGAGRDWVDALKPLTDHFDLDVAVTGVDARVNAGSLSEATFDASLAAAIGAGQLAAGHAVVFKPNAGDLAGHFFLVIDANGVAGYQAGADYVMEFAAGSNPNAIAVGFFI